MSIEIKSGPKPFEDMDPAVELEIEEIIPADIQEDIANLPSDKQERALEVYFSTIRALPESRQEDAWTIYLGHLHLAAKVMAQEITLKQKLKSQPTPNNVAWGPTLDVWHPPTRPE